MMDHLVTSSLEHMHLIIVEDSLVAEQVPERGDVQLAILGAVAFGGALVTQATWE